MGVLSVGERAPQLEGAGFKILVGGEGGKSMWQAFMAVKYLLHKCKPQAKNENVFKFPQESTQFTF